MSSPVNRSTRWRRALAVGAAMALPLGVTACADDDSDDPDIINEETEAPAPGAPPEEEPTEDPGMEETPTVPEGGEETDPMDEEGVG